MFDWNWESSIYAAPLGEKKKSAPLCVQTVQRTASRKAEEVTVTMTDRTKWGSSRYLGGWGDPRDLFASPPSRPRPNILSWWWSTTTKWWVKKKNYINNFLATYSCRVVWVIEVRSKLLSISLTHVLFVLQVLTLAMLTLIYTSHHTFSKWNVIA